MEEGETSTGSQTSEQGQKYDVFLSHSGKQKNFIRQLHRDLTSQGVSCFFDENSQCLPRGKDFPSRIFQAAQTCNVALLLLSKDYLESKWPMLELSAFVEARDVKRTNPNLIFLPLFFLISSDALKNTEGYEKKWQEFEIRLEKREEWQKALKVIKPINGLSFIEGGDEVKFRDEIIEEIWEILPDPSPRYYVSDMQGEERMCKEVENVFNKAQPQKEGVRIVGLYGIAGHGKTTLGKAFCNSKRKEFKGKVCHLEIGRGGRFERAKLALHYLTHAPQYYVQTLINEDQAKDLLHKRVEGKRVLLVLDNITEDSVDEVIYYLKAVIGGNSWILLSARSGEVLEKHFKIDRQSCMHVPSLMEEEAISILLERASSVESNLKKEDIGSALKCAKRCQFNEAGCDNGRMYHPLVLKAFGGYLFTKYGFTLRRWVAEIDGMVDRLGDSLDEVFDVLGKPFDEMPAKNRTIFMLLTVYILPNMSVDKIIEWMAINCNEKTSEIKKVLEDLRLKTFIQEIEPEIRIHDLYIELGQRKADRMERWLWWKQDPQDDTRGLISKDNGGFELAKLELCMYETIEQEYVRNLFVLQLVNVKDMYTVDFAPMKMIRSITLRDCESLEAVDGMEKLPHLAWLQIIEVNPKFKLPDISRLRMLQHLEIDIAGSQVICQLGDLTNCSRLRQISVVCPSLREVPGFQRLSNLTVLKLGKCGISEPPDLTGCKRLHDVQLFSLTNLKRFPNFSLLRELKKLILRDCITVKDPPDIEGCHELQVFHLLYNDNMKGLSTMDKCAQLQEIQVSWRAVDEIASDGILACCGRDRFSRQVNGKLELCPTFWKADKLENIAERTPEELKELQCVKGKTILLKRYYRGPTLYYSLTSPYNALHRKIVLKVAIEDEREKELTEQAVARLDGVASVAIDMKENKLTVIGDVDPDDLTTKLRERSFTELLSICDVEEELHRVPHSGLAEEELHRVPYSGLAEEKLHRVPCSGLAEEKDKAKEKQAKVLIVEAVYLPMPSYDYGIRDESPSCVIC